MTFSRYQMQASASDKILTLPGCFIPEGMGTLLIQEALCNKH